MAQPGGLTSGFAVHIVQFFFPKFSRRNGQPASTVSRCLNEQSLPVEILRWSPGGSGAQALQIVARPPNLSGALKLHVARPPHLAVLMTHCGQLILRKISNMMPRDVRF